MTSALNDLVRKYWERQPCGTEERIAGADKPLTREWFERIEGHRYAAEPCIHQIAQFTRHHGKRVLEIGVGAGTDHLQWARAGCDCTGVDLTDAAIETTRARLQLYGLQSRLQRADAEVLPFDDQSFDVVYSWGVIHHSERPASIVAEILRVLRPRGVFLGMVYHKHSVLAAKMWVRQALLRGRPSRSVEDVIWHHMESIGTKAYSFAGLRELLHGFRAIRIEPFMTPYDLSGLPLWFGNVLPARCGWFLGFEASR